jgi:major intracellular serine protease
MINFDNITIEAITTLDPKDMIPYVLTGARVLNKQGYNGLGVKVAVIDTGCDYNHPALMTSIIEKQHDFIGYNKGTSMDDQGHGTHVASSIVEIASGCEIVPYKVLAPYGGENAWLRNSLEHIANRDDIDVVNMSLSGRLTVGSSDYIALHNVIKKLVAKNIFVVVASGNTGTETELYPACFDEVTTVGAVDINKNEALFSTSSNHVDMCQVGVNLVGAQLGGGYVKMSGTSMATPMVAGIASLLIGKYKEQYGGKRPDGRLIHHMLKLSAIDMNIKGIDNKTGSGFISLDPSASVLKMTLDSTKLIVNGKESTMDVAPFIKQNRTFVPIRYASHEKFVDWDSSTRTVTIV